MNARPYMIRNAKYRFWNNVDNKWTNKSRGTRYTQDQHDNMVLERGTFWSTDRVPVPYSPRRDKRRVTMYFQLTHRDELYGYFEHTSPREVTQTLQEALQHYGYHKEAYKRTGGMRERLKSMSREGAAGIVFKARELEFRGLSVEEFCLLTERRQAA